MKRAILSAVIAVAVLFAGCITASAVDLSRNVQSKVYPKSNISVKVS